MRNLENKKWKSWKLYILKLPEHLFSMMPLKWITAFQSRIRYTFTRSFLSLNISQNWRPGIEKTIRLTQFLLFHWQLLMCSQTRLMKSLLLSFVVDFFVVTIVGKFHNLSVLFYHTDLSLFFFSFFPPFHKAFYNNTNTNTILVINKK